MTTTSIAIAPTDVTSVALERFLEVFHLEDLFGRYFVAEDVSDAGEVVIDGAGIATSVRRRRGGNHTIVVTFASAAECYRAEWSFDLWDVVNYAMVEVTGEELAAIEYDETLR
jgi:hypothetical protein